MLFVTCFVLLINSLIHIVDVVRSEEESDKEESRHNVYKRARRSFSSSSPLFNWSDFFRVDAFITSSTFCPDFLALFIPSTDQLVFVDDSYFSSCSKDIQNGKNGHCSVEDASACMELVQLKIENGRAFNIDLHK